MNECGKTGYSGEYLNDQTGIFHLEYDECKQDNHGTRQFFRRFHRSSLNRVACSGKAFGIYSKAVQRLESDEEANEMPSLFRWHHARYASIPAWEKNPCHTRQEFQ